MAREIIIPYIQWTERLNQSEFVREVNERLQAIAFYANSNPGGEIDPDLEQRVAQNEADIAALQSDLSALTSRVATNESNIASNTSRISANEAAIALLDGRLTIAETEIDALDARLVAAEEDIGILAQLAQTTTTEITYRNNTNWDVHYVVSANTTIIRVGYKHMDPGTVNCQPFLNGTPIGTSPPTPATVDDSGLFWFDCTTNNAATAGDIVQVRTTSGSNNNGLFCVTQVQIQNL